MIYSVLQSYSWRKIWNYEPNTSYLPEILSSATILRKMRVISSFNVSRTVIFKSKMRNCLPSIHKQTNAVNHLSISTHTVPGCPCFWIILISFEVFWNCLLNSFQLWWQFFWIWKLSNASIRRFQNPSLYNCMGVGCVIHHFLSLETTQ